MQNSLIGIVREERTPAADFVNLYYRQDKDITIMDKSEAALSRKSYDSLSRLKTVCSWSLLFK